MSGKTYCKYSIGNKAVALGVLFTMASGTNGMLYLYSRVTAIALFIGVLIAMAIGGADMPVVVSMLNFLL
ncbi:MAG: NAD(P)(+) transhydrogenase (Re/Si-specific) subunit beta [Saprospiraceae bacterium]